MKNIILLILIPNFAIAVAFELPKKGDLIGQTSQIQLTEPTTLMELARRYHLGPREMETANPKYTKKSEIPAGETIVIPSQFILPTVREGIVINNAELRLYYFPEGSNIVETFPIAVGKAGRSSPTGVTTVERKEKDPWWHPPESARAENPSLPRAVRPGPNNPLGKYVLRLGMTSMGIHGTNKPDSVGTPASLGCYRMRPDDILHLFETVPLKTKVTIISQPVRFGLKDKQVYLKLLRPLHEHLFEQDFKTALTELEMRTNGLHRFAVEPQAIKKLPKDAIPAVVGSFPLDG